MKFQGPGEGEPRKLHREEVGTLGRGSATLESRVGEVAPKAGRRGLLRGLGESSGVFWQVSLIWISLLLIGIPLVHRSPGRGSQVPAWAFVLLSELRWCGGNFRHLGPLFSCPSSGLVAGIFAIFGSPSCQPNILTFCLI